MCVLKMLLNLHKKSWIDGLTLEEYKGHCTGNETIVKDMLELAKNYNKVRTTYMLFLTMWSCCFIILSAVHNKV